MLKYLQQTLSLAKGFVEFEVSYIPREENARADLLAHLANTKGSGFNRSIIQKPLESLSIDFGEVMVLDNAQGWRWPIIRYFTHD